MASRGGDRDFKFYPEPKEFKAAQTHCKNQRGGRLARIMSRAEQELLEEMLPYPDYLKNAENPENPEEATTEPCGNVATEGYDNWVGDTNGTIPSVDNCGGALEWNEEPGDLGSAGTAHTDAGGTGNAGTKDAGGEKDKANIRNQRDTASSTDVTDDEASITDTGADAGAGTDVGASSGAGADDGASASAGADDGAGASSGSDAGADASSCKGDSALTVSNHLVVGARQWKRICLTKAKTNSTTCGCKQQKTKKPFVCEFQSLKLTGDTTATRIFPLTNGNVLIDNVAL